MRPVLNYLTNQVLFCQVFFPGDDLIAYDRIALGVFAKFPQPGLVKSRIAEATSPEWAARVADAFIRDTVDRLAEVRAHRILVYTPAEKSGYFAEVSGGRFELLPQADGDLGARLSRFFTSQMPDAHRVVVVGTDSPTLPCAFVGQAFQELERADVVLGPANDGGYYLVGCANRVPPIFDGISWGSELVLAQTVARLAEPTWRLALLPPWYDIDLVRGWQVLRGHIAAMRRAGIDPGVPTIEELIDRHDTEE